MPGLILFPVASKTCTKCSEIKPIENFYTRSGASDGKSSACKTCIEAHKKAKRLLDNAEWHKKKADASQMQKSGIRKCTCCKDVFPLTSDFYNLRKDKSPAFSSRCKPCEARKNKENRFTRDPAQKASVEKREQLKADGLRKCGICKTTHPATTEFFYTDKGIVVGACRPCAKSREAESRINCKDRKAEYSKMYFLKNKLALNATSKEYRHKNREFLNAASKLNYRKDPKKYIANSLLARAKRRKIDPLFAMQERVRSSVGYAFRVNGYTKRSKTQEILGCDWSFFRSHVERQFVKGMSWENRKDWHLDHIVPLASAITEGDVMALNHFTNLRPMWAKDNIAKSDNITHLI